jgi:hypothetical protein
VEEVGSALGHADADHRALGVPREHHTVVPQALPQVFDELDTVGDEAVERPVRVAGAAIRAAGPPDRAPVPLHHGEVLFP